MTVPKDAASSSSPNPVRFADRVGALFLNPGLYLRSLGIQPNAVGAQYQYDQLEHEQRKIARRTERRLIAEFGSISSAIASFPTQVVQQTLAITPTPASPRPRTREELLLRNLSRWSLHSRLTVLPAAWATDSPNALGPAGNGPKKFGYDSMIEIYCASSSVQSNRASGISATFAGPCLPSHSGEALNPPTHPIHMKQAEHA
jgi:hypothetical protein